MASGTPKYHLTYWPGIPGRGEYIRLALEAAGADYADTPGGVEENLQLINPDTVPISDNSPQFAPPSLRCGDLQLHQTAAILQFLGSRLNLAPQDEEGRARVLALALTALDLSSEAHNTHHPIDVTLYYEDQKDEAARNAKQFREKRIPKFLKYFERVLAGGEWLVGKEMTYADLVLWQTIDGLLFAFPKKTKKVLGDCSNLKQHYDRVAEVPKIKAYLESGRRQKFSQGIFRYYEELDLE